MKLWHIEYYYPFPNIRFTFKVNASTMEEAKAYAEKAVAGLRLSGCYEDRLK